MIHTTKARLVCDNYCCRSKYQPKSKALAGIRPFYRVKDEIFHFVTMSGKSKLEVEQELKKFQ